MIEPRIFRYVMCEPEEKERIRQFMEKLVFAQAFLGESFGAICSAEICFRWFVGCVLEPYILYAEDFIYIAEVDGRLAGYLTGSYGGKEFLRQQEKIVEDLSIPFVYEGFLSEDFNYRRLSRYLSGQFLAQKKDRLLGTRRCQRPSRPEDHIEWHFQVGKDYQGKGVGQALFNRFQEDAMDDGQTHICAEVLACPTHKNGRTREYFVKRYGEPFDERPFTMFGATTTDVSILRITFPLERGIVKQSQMVQVAA